MRLKDDNGYVLAATLGAIMLVTAIALASYSLSQQALEQASSNAKASRAYQIANSALEYETSRYENDGDISSQDGKQLRSGGTYDLITETSGSSVTITCRATVPPETETVSVTYTVFDFSETLYSGGGNSLFSGASFNAKDSMVIGSLYLKLPSGERVNSCPSFVDGPLYIENAQLTANTSVSFIPPEGASKYQVYSDVKPIISSTAVQINTLKEHMSPPDISEDLIEQLRNEATGQGHYFVADSSGYFNIGSDSSPIPTEGGTLEGSGTIFVEGTAILDSNISSYSGNWTIFATKGILARGRLVPDDYASNPTNPPAYSYDPKYSAIIAGKSDELPQARPTKCITLITPGSINSTWAYNSNATTHFGFCGAMFSGGTISFQESLRGSIIACDSLAPDKKTILATQNNLRECLNPIARTLFSKAMTKGDWTRSKN